MNKNRHTKGKEHGLEDAMPSKKVALVNRKTQMGRWQSIAVSCLSLALGLFTSQSLAVAAPKLTGYIPLQADVFQSLPRVPRFRSFLPPKVDLSKSFPTPGMQDAQSSSGWAVGYAARSYYTGAAEKRDISDEANIPSPAFIYNSIRDPKDCGSGSLLLDALSLLGKGSLSIQEFSAHGCKIPSDAERQAATDFKITKWLAVVPQQIDDVKGQLARGNPVIFGADIDETFESLKGDAVYRGGSKGVDQHAMTIVGYDDQRQAFKVINSWGTLWGDKGFGWIDYGTFKKDAREAYVIEINIDSEPLPADKPVVEPEAEVDDDADADVETSAVKPKPMLNPNLPVVNPVPPPSPYEQTQKPVPAIERPVADSDCSYVYSDESLGRSSLVGFVGTEAELVALRNKWNGYSADFKVDLRPWPQCEVLLNVAAVIDDKNGPQLKTRGGVAEFSEGQEMVFELTTPSVPSYVYVIYIQADGNVVTLLQPESDLTPSLRNQVLIFGSGEGGSARFLASRPFGAEMVLALSAESPLFDKGLPKVQTEREFLSALRRALLYKADNNRGDRRIAAAFVGLNVGAQK